MNYTLSSALYALPQYASILVSGDDASTFLQGQLSFDMSRLTAPSIGTCELQFGAGSGPGRGVDDRAR